MIVAGTSVLTELFIDPWVWTQDPPSKPEDGAPRGQVRHPQFTWRLPPVHCLENAKAAKCTVTKPGGTAQSR